jgi:alanine dehydrogenase
MLIGVPKEVKNHEYRVGATPCMVRAMVEAGHTVKVERSAGLAVGFSDDHYVNAGALICPDAPTTWDSAMIIKVKEPQSQEFELMHEGQVLFCYLHLAPDLEQTRNLLQQKVVAIAYETVTSSAGTLPLLLPMSEIAGRIAVQAGATALQMNNGGRGVLLGGVPGVLPAKVVVVGGGIVGTEAARMAMGLGADVTVLDRSLSRLRSLDEMYGPRLKTLYSAPETLEEVCRSADLVIGSVLIPGKSAPKLITRQLVSEMCDGAVIVDVAIDQGGCSETSRPTTHSDPTYIEEGVVHYCVTNMPGACARTATQALTNATRSYALNIANKGYRQALRDDIHLRAGLNVHLGQVTNEAVAHDLNYDFHSPKEVLEGALNV